MFWISEFNIPRAILGFVVDFFNAAGALLTNSFTEILNNF